MKNFINWLFNKKVHVHDYKPIISRYVSFNSRDIMYECTKCYHKKHQYISRPFDISFPIETTAFISYNEFNDILKSKTKYKK